MNDDYDDDNVMEVNFDDDGDEDDACSTVTCSLSDDDSIMSQDAVDEDAVSDGDDDYTQSVEESEHLLVEDVVVLKGDNRKTSSLLTQYEIAKLLSVRVTHLARGAAPLINTPMNSDTKLLDVAWQEIRQGVCPYIIRRRINECTCEDWYVSELIAPEHSVS